MSIEPSTNPGTATTDLLVREDMLRLLSIGAGEAGAERMPHQDVPRGVYEAVDLSVAYSPVLPPRCLVPKSAVRQVDGRYTIDDLPGYFGGHWLPDTFHVEAAELRLWRARYLMFRDLLFHALVFDDFRHVAPFIPDVFCHSVRTRVLAVYFPQGVFVPGRGNPVHDAMNPEAPPHGPYHFGDGSIAVDAREVSRA